MSFLSAHSLSSTRTRADSFAGTSSTVSPAATSCWATSAPSTACALDRPDPRCVRLRELQQPVPLMTVRPHSQLVEELLVCVQHRCDVRTLVRIDPDREHHQPPDTSRTETPRRASLKRVECPILFRATPQPSTDGRSVRSKANPHGWQGILETTHRNPRRVRAPRRARITIIIQGNLARRACSERHEFSNAVVPICRGE